MTAAAEELCVTHGAVSRQVAGLQSHLEVTLVTGPRHRLRLTPVGAELAARLSQGFATISEAVAEACAERPREIVISCLGTFALKWLIPRLGEFLSAHPTIRVRVSESYAPVDFRRDRFDGAIRIFDPGVTAPAAEVVTFMDQYQGPLGSPTLCPVDITLEAFGRLPRLTASSFRESWLIWQSLTGIDLPAASVEREFQHNSSTLEAAAAGMGVAITPWAFVAPDIMSGRLVAPFGFTPERSKFVFLSSADRCDPAVDAFRDWLIVQGGLSPSPPITNGGVATRNAGGHIGA